MSNPDGWTHAHDDPTAGVRLWPKAVECPRCGRVKGTTREKPRAGLCRDCSEVLEPADRAAWKAA